MKLKKTPFTGCEIVSSDFLRSDLSETDFSNTVFRDVSFNGANLSKAVFIGAKGYLINPLFTNVKKAVFSLPDAVSMLEEMGIVIR
jgi:uncharacterized protein YjbI with pentapeptide repeats